MFYKIFTCLLFCLLLNVSYLFGEATFSDNIWDTYNDLARAKTILNSNEDDNDAKIKASFTLFKEAIYHSQNKSEKEELLLVAHETLKPLFFENDEDAKISSFYGMITLSLAGVSRSIPKKIKYSNIGIAALNNALALEEDNIEIRYIYAISTIEIPTYFKNLTDDIIENTLYFLKKSSQFKNNKVINREKQAILVILSSCYQRKKDIDNLKLYLKQVDENLLKEIGTNFILSEYKKLKDKYL